MCGFMDALECARVCIGVLAACGYCWLGINQWNAQGIGDLADCPYIALQLQMGELLIYPSDDPGHNMTL